MAERLRREAQARRDQLRACNQPGRQGLGKSGRTGINREAERLGAKPTGALDGTTFAPWVEGLCHPQGKPYSPAAFHGAYANPVVPSYESTERY